MFKNHFEAENIRGIPFIFIRTGVYSALVEAPFVLDSDQACYMAMGSVAVCLAGIAAETLIRSAEHINEVLR